MPIRIGNLACSAPAGGCANSPSHRFIAFVILLDQLREILQGLPLPAVQLIRIDPAFKGNLFSDFTFAQNFRNHLRFLAG
jgi:hypothetical protein